MTLRICPRLAVFATVALLHWSAPAVAQSTASKTEPPPFAERLDRLAEEIERIRIDLHVPGVALAIVRGDEVIFARGFGLADVSKKTPVTPGTPFFIGSTTKAFTATLVGMLVDEGRMKWDDPVEKYVPQFKLAVQSKDPDDRATLRDVLSHRTGFTRMVLLEMNTGMSSEEILRRASAAEAFAPFRKRFLYNNEHYLAAGLAAAAAAGTSWDALVKARILTPLGMTATRTTQEAWSDPRTARAYWWNEARKEFEPQALETLGVNIDGLAPAGAISSTALDMASWIRFLLRQGVNEGKALISPASLAATWTSQISIGDSSGYGMGWFVHKWQGQRLIEHGGTLPGFSAEVGLLPDSNIGFVVLTNAKSALPSVATRLVPQYLLGELPPASKGRPDLKPYVGTKSGQEPEDAREDADDVALAELQKYVGRYVDATGKRELGVVIQNERLAVRLPNNRTLELRPPDAAGRRAARANAAIALVFEESPTGLVTALDFHPPGSQAATRLTPTSEPLPSVAEIVALRSIPATPIGAVRSTGRVRFAQSGVEGRFVSVAAGDGRIRHDIDLDRIGKIQVALDKERGWASVTGGPFRELTGKELKEKQLGHASGTFGDWRKRYDAVRVLRAGQVDGRKVYVVQLESAGLPSTVVSVDAQTGDVLQIQRSLMEDGGGRAMTTTFSNYRDVDGLRVAHRFVQTTEQSGNTIYEIERVEIGVELSPEVFTLQPRK